MKTDKLIEMLSNQAGPAPRHAVEKRLWPVALLGLALSALAGIVVMGLVPMSVMMHWGWWVKFGYATALVAVGGWMTVRLARPVQQLAGPQMALMAVLALIGLAGVAYWLMAMPELRWAELIGHSWQTCPRNVILMSVPPMAAAFWALRGLAPTRPRLAGAAAGLFAGALGAAAYALSCTEIATSFVAVWYTLGVAGSVAIGALVGPWVLRW